MKKTLIRLLSVVIAVCCVCGLMAPAAMAAPVADATIDTTKTGSVTLYKYDYTNSYKDGVWNPDDYTSTGVEDKENVNDVLGGGSSSTLGNGETANGYAIPGVEFSYLMIGEPTTFTDVKDGTPKVMLLYGLKEDDILFSAIGLDIEDRYKNADILNHGVNSDDMRIYFESNVLIAALNAALAADPTYIRNELELYVNEVGTAMPLTDENGMSTVSGLSVGLYLFVETKVTEMVTSTTAPFLLSIPTTSVDGNNATDGGHRWIYDLVIYPKNETGIVTLEKEVKENGNDEEFSHNATASTGDVVDYQITSTLPTITSSTTYIGTYTFKDTLSTALSYNKDVVIDWYSDKDCTNHVARWDAESGKYTVVYGEDNTMTITMTAAGLAEINTAADTYKNVNNDGNMKYAGYSNYTIRISYTATLHADDSFTFGDKGNDNDVTLTWSRTSENYYDVLNDDCHVYAYGINLVKLFSDMDNATAESKGLYDHVKFKLQNTTDGYYVVAKLDVDTGIYYVTGTTANEEEAPAFEPVTAYAGTAAEAHGQIIIKGLEDDTYVLTEAETANGYVLMESGITVVITATEDASRPCGVYGEDNKGLTQNDGRYDADGIQNSVSDLTNIPQTQLAHVMLTASATFNGKAVDMDEDMTELGEQTGSTNAAVPVVVTNDKGYDIPETGDDSMMYLTILGSCVVICAAAMLFMVLGKKREHK